MISYLQLDYQEAKELLDYIVEQAGNRRVAICVVDATGKLLAAASINGVGQHYMDFALAKARTALHEQTDTVNLRFHQPPGKTGWWSDKPSWSVWEIGHAAQLSPGFCGWAGGSVVLNPANGFVAGGIGVSGLAELEDHSLAILRPSGWTE